jgi:hypothetical protein
LPAVDPAPPEHLWGQPLLGVPDLLRSMGASFEAVAQRAAFPTTALDDPENRIPFVEVARLLSECATATGCPHFGVLLGQRAGLPAVGLAGELAAHSTSVLQSLRSIQAHLHLHDSGAALGLHQRSHRELELAYVIYHPDHPGARHMAEAALAIAMSVLRALCGATWAPIEVTFACDRPRDPSAYRDCFGPSLRFNAPRFAVVLDTSWLSRPVPGADATQRVRLAKRVTELERSRRPSTSERTRESLTQMLIERPPRSTGWRSCWA